MAKLALLKDGEQVGEFPLESQEVSIGRDVHADIRLNDPSVSRHHARILKIHTDFYVEDLNSTNGTQLNGRSIKKHVLKPDDLFVIGSNELRFVVDEAQGAEAEAPPDQVVPEKPAVPRSAHKKANLRFFRGPDKGITIRIDRALYTIGKPGGDVAAIARRPQGFFLLHIGGDNYPRINEKEIESGGAGVQLNEGDMIQVGEHLAEITFEE